MLNLFDEKIESGQIFSKEYLTEGAVPPLIAVIVVALVLTSCPGQEEPADEPEPEEA